MGKPINSLICDLFEVHVDGKVQCVIMPFTYVGTNDNVVIRVRDRNGYWQVDDNGDAALYASMQGGDTTTEAVTNYTETGMCDGLILDDDEVIIATQKNDEHLATTVFNVAQAAQGLYAIATNKKLRISSDFKALLSDAITHIAQLNQLPIDYDQEVKNTGGLYADFVLKGDLYVIAATSTVRLLEAEILHMHLKTHNQKGFVLAIAENQKTVGVKQFERANYFTGKTVSYNPEMLPDLISHSLYH